MADVIVFRAGSEAGAWFRFLIFFQFSVQVFSQFRSLRVTKV